jgi:hypothetical protein
MIRRVVDRAYKGISWRLWHLRRWFGLAGTLEGVVFHVVSTKRLKQFHFVEVGVFKGDNALKVIRAARDAEAAVTYIGFDLFENKDEFFERHPDDLAMYDTPGDSYFEFKSGEHGYSAVRNKLNAVLTDSQFRLIAGDSTETLPASRGEIEDASIVYIDGCHDYDVVSKDWGNIRPLFDHNRELVVVFDDMTYDGVRRLMTDIRNDGHGYRVYTLNANQFLVVSGSTKMKERLTYKAAGAIQRWREWRAERKRPVAAAEARTVSQRQ